MHFPRTAISLAAALLAGSVHAQQEVEVQPQPGNQLERVEVRGQRPQETELRRRAPVAKQIYGREELDKYGDTQLSTCSSACPASTSPAVAGCACAASEGLSPSCW